MTNTHSQSPAESATTSKKYLILYSTETGRAKACARRAFRILRSGGIPVSTPRAFDEHGAVASLRDVFLVCFVSTAGEGEHTSTIKNTWRELLRKSQPALCDMEVALFCLGDRAYGELFCAAGRKFGARMKQLGAEMACGVGYGDDEGDLFGDLDVWMEKELLACLDWKESSIRIEEELPEVIYQDAEENQDWSRFAPPSALCREAQTGTVVGNERMTSADWKQDVRHITLQHNCYYRPGDVAAILPTNTHEDVLEFVSFLSPALQSTLKKTFLLDGFYASLYTLLRRVFDIHSHPEREDLFALSNISKDPQHSSKLLHMSQSEGSSLYVDYILRNKRTWIEVLHDFDSIQFHHVHQLSSLLPKIKCRSFSIASAPSDQTMQLCIAVVDQTTPLGRSYKGLCSNYLATLQTDASIDFWILPGSFRQCPLDLQLGRFKTPVLYIGAGTGIAPLRSMIREREHLRSQCLETPATQPQDQVLLFGCRKQGCDFLYHGEWTHLQSRQNLRLLKAFSQDAHHKVYVQHLLAESKNQLFLARHILESNGAVYVAGGKQMAKAVREEILAILSKFLAGEEKEARLVLKRLNKRGLFRVEAW